MDTFPDPLIGICLTGRTWTIYLVGINRNNGLGNVTRIIYQGEISCFICVDRIICLDGLIWIHCMMRKNII